LSRILQIALAVLVLLAAIFLVASRRYMGKAPVKLPAGNCDPSLWNHIYAKERLRVVEPCTVVDGRVVSLTQASDGDLHLGLDPDRKSVLNLMNATHAHGELVVEVICEHVTSRDVPKDACGDYHSQIAVPKLNDRVRVTGAYVTDLEHGWREIHPVTRIEILR
jgi:hypothetical protein